jgi:dipeptidyl aminopeptidase/acylaminoacyl peptidase
MGASYGGFAALAGVTLQHGIYRCAVSVAGVSDVARLASTNIVGSNYDKAMRHAVEQELGARRDLRAISPINFATGADAPILLIHGKDDIVVPYDQSNDMAVALQRAGKPVGTGDSDGRGSLAFAQHNPAEMPAAACASMEQHNPADPVR